MNPLPLYRLANALHRRGVKKIPNLIVLINTWLTHCEIPARVTIGKRVVFKHGGFGVILNANTILGDDVIVMPHVIIGQNVRHRGEVVSIDRIVIGDRVLLGAGAKVICSGYLEIEEDVAVGANAVVLRSVRAGATVVGIPAREV